MQRYRVDEDTGCWNWIGTVNRQGYGVLSLRGQQVIATRLGYSLLVGPIPDGRLLCHSCDNRLCVNPAHLYAGTIQQNNQDTTTRGRWAKGERIAGAKVTEEVVRQIRVDWDAGMAGVCLAEKYSLSQPQVAEIGRRAAWRHVPELASGSRDRT